jgi:hypothetical protein
VNLIGANDCNPTGVIYLTPCEECKKEYIGPTVRNPRERFGEHLCIFCQKKEVTLCLHKSLTLVPESANALESNPKNTQLQTRKASALDEKKFHEVPLRTKQVWLTTLYY